MKLKNEWINGDCLKELKNMPDESVHLIITSPPYHNLRVYSNDPCDLSNCESYDEYYYLLGLVIAECQRVLVPGGKFVLQYEDYNYTIGRDRIHRIGQNNKCTYIVLQANNTIEEKIYNCVQRKGNAVDELYFEMGLRNAS